jgi:transposase
MLYYGIDVHTKRSNFAVLDDEAEVVQRGDLTTTKKSFTAAFSYLSPVKVAIEAGAQSHWIAELLTSFGHEVVVANPRRVQLIAKSREKDDASDAEKLARLLRADPSLLHPTYTRDIDNLALRGMLKARAGLVECRTKLINTVRGLVKPFGANIGKAESHHFAEVVKNTQMPAGARAVVSVLLPHIEQLSLSIEAQNKAIEAVEIERPDHPIRLMKTVPGVANLIALAFVAYIDDPTRFSRGDQVGNYFGLTSGRRFSGGGGYSLGITKEGDPQMRSLMIQAAYAFLHCKQDSELRQWALQLMERKGGPGCRDAKKKTACALARKLTILLHRIWITNEPYQPFHHAQKKAERMVVNG